MINSLVIWRYIGSRLLARTKWFSLCVDVVEGQAIGLPHAFVLGQRTRIE